MRAFLIAVLSASLSTSPWSCLTLFCQPWFLSISSLNTCMKTFQGLWGGPSSSAVDLFFSSFFLPASDCSSFLPSADSDFCSFRRTAVDDRPRPYSAMAARVRGTDEGPVATARRRGARRAAKEAAGFMVGWNVVEKDGRSGGQSVEKSPQAAECRLGWGSQYLIPSAVCITLGRREPSRETPIG